MELNSSPPPITAPILAIDPGREKCGAAILAPDKRLIAKGIINTLELSLSVKGLVDHYRISTVLLGNRTGAIEVEKRLSEFGVNPTRVDEHGSTLEARRRYFADYPPRGWRRFIPRSLQVPPEPYDDYAAVILAERFIDLHH